MKRLAVTLVYALHTVLGINLLTVFGILPACDRNVTWPGRVAQLFRIFIFLSIPPILFSFFLLVWVGLFGWFLLLFLVWFVGFVALDAIVREISGKLMLGFISVFHSNRIHFCPVKSRYIWTQWCLEDEPMWNIFKHVPVVLFHLRGQFSLAAYTSWRFLCQV